MLIRKSQTLLALGLGLVLTAGLATAAYLLHRAGAEGIARALFWQNTLLQSLIPLHNIGTLEKPVYEGTPLNYLAFLATFPIGFIVYSVIAYVGLSRRTHNDT